MPRIRTIKPEFFKNEHLADFPYEHRLLFAGLWTQADRAGRLEDRPKRLKAELFPYDALDIDAMLEVLSGGTDPLIVRYVVDGKPYIWIRKFQEHQRPHHTEPASECPYAPGECAPENNGEAPEKDGETPLGREGKGKEWNGNEEGKGEVSLALVVVASPKALVQAWNDGTTPPLPRVQELTHTRQQRAQARLRDAVLDVWREVIARIDASPFCRGENDRGWVASFDWMLQPDVRVKVLEGKYDPRGKSRSGSRTGDTFEAGKDFMADVMRRSS